MTSPISDDLLCQLSGFLEAQMGLHYPPERWKDLERGLRTAAPDLGCPDVESCIRWLLSTPLTKTQIEVLASHLTIGETYFFRDRRSFEHLEQDVLPGIIRSRAQSSRQIRIWSAGCCSGEEPYSIAMILHKIIPDRSNWKITVLGTDVNPRFLEKAGRAVYSQWSFRGTPSSMRDRFFTTISKGQYELRAEVREMVTFRYLNLSEDAYPSLINGTTGMDLILCRNVLIYFSGEGGKRVINGFYRCLVDGGWLLVSASESSHVNDSGFTPVSFPEAIFYQKAPATSSPPVTPPVTPPVEAASLPDMGRPLLRSLQPTKGAVRSNQRESLVPGSNEVRPVAQSLKDAYPVALDLYRQGRTAEAAAKLNAVVAQNGSISIEDAPSCALLARIYANEGKLSDAMEWCDRAIGAHKTESTYRYLRATILQEQGNAEDATASLKGAIYLDGDFVLAHFALGNLAQQQGRLEEGDKHLQNAHLLLSRYSDEDQLPEGEGLTAGRLAEVIASLIEKRAPS